MSATRQWTITKEPTGFRLISPRRNLFVAGISIYLTEREAQQCRASLTSILKRLQRNHFHTWPLTIGLRLIHGFWQRSIKEIHFFGRVGKKSCHVVRLGDGIYLLNFTGDQHAHPISQNDLEKIHSQLG